MTTSAPTPAIDFALMQTLGDIARYHAQERPEANAADIIAFARTRIAAFKAPKSVDFIAALPRNASGKILCKDLREPYWAGRERRVN